MKRREFITLLGGAAAAWPLAARAQQAERCGASACFRRRRRSRYRQTRITAFVQGLQELGWTDGRNVQIDPRWAKGNIRALRPRGRTGRARARVILTRRRNVGPLLQATSTMPIVFVRVADPVGAGFVDSLARPGGNVTGFMHLQYILSGKWLELLKQIVPGVTRVAILRDAAQNRRNRPVWCDPGRGAVARREASPVNVRDGRRDRSGIVATSRDPRMAA